jgi:hypothetical protein
MTMTKAARRDARKKKKTRHADGWTGSAKAMAAVPPEAARIIAMVAAIVPDVTRQMIPGVRKSRDIEGNGLCVHSCMVVGQVLRHYGIDAEMVPVTVRVADDDNRLAIESIVVGNFAGHMVTRVRFPRLDLLIDLTLDQFSNPSHGINPPPAIVTGWDADGMDTGMVSVDRPGRGRIDYTLRPGMDDWQTFARFDTEHEALHRQSITEIADVVIARLRSEGHR